VQEHGTELRVWEQSCNLNGPPNWSSLVRILFLEAASAGSVDSCRYPTYGTGTKHFGPQKLCFSPYHAILITPYRLCSFNSKHLGSSITLKILIETAGIFKSRRLSNRLIPNSAVLLLLTYCSIIEMALVANMCRRRIIARTSRKSLQPPIAVVLSCSS